MVNRIIEETGVTVDINEDGNIFVTSPNVEGIDKAIKMIEDIVREIKVGEIFEGTVTRIATFGAFVELTPGKEGMCHVSQLSTKRVDKVEDVVKVGDKLQVKVMEIDERGKIDVSHSAVIDPNSPQRSRPGAGGGNGGNRRNDSRSDSRGSSRNSGRSNSMANLKGFGSRTNSRDPRGDRGRRRD